MLAYHCKHVSAQSYHSHPHENSPTKAGRRGIKAMGLLIIRPIQKSCTDRLFGKLGGELMEFEALSKTIAPHSSSCSALHEWYGVKPGT